MELTRTDSRPLLVLALPEESRPLLKALASAGWRQVASRRRGPAGTEAELDGLRVLTTGMGERNARTSVAESLMAGVPPWVITGGIAGGLHPDLATGDARFDADPEFPMTDVLQRMGVAAGRCTMVGRIAVTPADKSRLRAETGADLVDMESAAIRELCRGQGIPSATLRTVSDTAHEALPLDFGQLTDADQRLVWWKLAQAILRAPGCIPGLMRLQRNVTLASGRLANVLTAVAASARGPGVTLP